MSLAFLVILILAGVWIFRQGKQLAYYKNAFEEQIEWRKAQQFHINTVEAENRRYADKVRKFENSLAHLDPGHSWQLRDSPNTSISTDPHAIIDGAKKPKD
jgi:hypothetical protein